MRAPAAVVREYLRCLERDHDGLDDVVADDVRVLAPDGSVAFSDRETWKRAVAAEPFEDERIEVVDLVTEGEKVALRYSLECVHRESGRRVSTSGTKIYRVRDSRIAEIAGHDDVLGVLRQLGIVHVDL